MPGFPALLRTTKREGEKRDEASLPLEGYRNATGVPEDVKLTLPDKVLYLSGAFSNLQGAIKGEKWRTRSLSPTCWLQRLTVGKGYP